MLGLTYIPSDFEQSVFVHRCNDVAVLVIIIRCPSSTYYTLVQLIALSFNGF